MHYFFKFWLLQLQYISRSIWVHSLNNLTFEKGEFYTLYPDLRHFPAKFFRMYRMSISKFDNLLKILHPRLQLKQTNFISNISPKQQLVLTLRFVHSEQNTLNFFNTNLMKIDIIQHRSVALCKYDLGLILFHENFSLIQLRTGKSHWQTCHKCSLCKSILKLHIKLT